MVQSLTPQADFADTDALQWTTVCALEAIAPNTGVNALVGSDQVAVFRIGETQEVYAVSNFEPFSKALCFVTGYCGRSPRHPQSGLSHLQAKLQPQNRGMPRR